MDPTIPANQNPVPPVSIPPDPMAKVSPVQTVFNPPPSTPPQPPFSGMSSPSVPPELEKKRNVKLWIILYVLIGVILFVLLQMFVLPRFSGENTPPPAPKVTTTKAKPTPTTAATTSA